MWSKAANPSGRAPAAGNLDILRLPNTTLAIITRYPNGTYGVSFLFFEELAYWLV